MTVALWVKPSIDKSALLIPSAQFSLWRLVDGRISWSVNGNEGYGGGSALYDGHGSARRMDARRPGR